MSKRNYNIAQYIIFTVVALVCSYFLDMNLFHVGYWWVFLGLMLVRTLAELIDFIYHRLKHKNIS